uniref:Uncharacterized protein n=1 Tax=Picea sitchensis TaxID=3332 RepID=B8LRI1_PICSI|nr:unknown [Picea sitchensis]
MAAESALLPLLRRLSRPYLSIQKAPLLSSLQSRLFHASTEPLQRISMLDQIRPPGGLQTKSVLGLLQSGSPASNCRNYAKARKPVSGDDEDIDEVDSEDNSDEDMDFNEDSSDDSDDAEGSGKFSGKFSEEE